MTTLVNSTEAYETCRQITRARARNFYYGLKLLPEPQRSSLYAVYTWMRMADDLVDDAATSKDAAEALSAFRAQTESALNGRPHSNEAVWIALADVAGRTALEHEPFNQMLQGQLDDIQEQRYETFADLERYCHRVASSVGLVCIAIWGYEGSRERAEELATKRGVAFQLTNILRDFNEDYAIGRVYLPADEFKAHNLTPTQLNEWSDKKACLDFTTEQIDRAMQYYIESEELDAMITPRCQPTLWAMTRIYRQLLTKLSENPARLADPRRLRLSGLQKSAIAIQARLRSSQANRK